MNAKSQQSTVQNQTTNQNQTQNQVQNQTQQQIQNNNQSTSGATNPWAPQQPYLLAGFNAATNALNQSTNNNPIPTQFTASYTPDQVSLFQQMLGVGGSAPGAAASSANAGGILNSAGAGATQGGLTALANYTPGGGTESNIDAANAYASGQNIAPMVQAAMRDANQEASEFTIPGINRADAASGNINSSKNAISQGIVDRGLAQQAGDISAQLRGQAYSQGLNLAEQNSEAANNNILSSILGRVSGGTGAVNAGTNANTGSVGQLGGLYNIAQGGSQGITNANQAPLTNANQVFQANATYPFTSLNQYMPLIQGNYGSSYNTNSVGNANASLDSNAILNAIMNSVGNSSGTSTTTNSPSTLAQIGGWTNFIGSLL